METIFMNTENSKTNEPHKLRLSLSGKLNLKSPNKNIALVNLSIYYTWKNIKSAYNNNKFKIFAPIWNDTSDLPENSPIEVYPNKIKNRIVFKTKTECKLELLSPETMKLLGSTKKDVDQDKNGEDKPKLESAEVVLVHCNLCNNNYQQASKVLFTCAPNKQFGQLINIAPHSLTMLRNFHLLKCGLLIKIVSLSKLKIMSI